MVSSRRGQGITEYIVMTAILTLIGVWLMNGVGGQSGLTSLSGKRGAIYNVNKNTTKAIAEDK